MRKPKVEKYRKITQEQWSSLIIKEDKSELRGSEL